MGGKHLDQLLSALPSAGSAASSAGFPGWPWGLQSALSAGSVLSDTEKRRGCPGNALQEGAAVPLSSPDGVRALPDPLTLAGGPALSDPGFDHPGNRATPWPACQTGASSREGREQAQVPALNVHHVTDTRIEEIPTRRPFGSRADMA